MGRILSPNLPVSVPLQRPDPRRRAESGPTKALIGFIASLDLETIDAMTLERANAHTLDTIGACLAGSRQPATEIAERVVGETGGGHPGAEVVARLYDVPAEDVQFVFCDNALAIKASIPRPVIQGDPGDADGHGGQQFAPLIDIEIE